MNGKWRVASKEYEKVGTLRVLSNEEVDLLADGLRSGMYFRFMVDDRRCGAVASRMREKYGTVDITEVYAGAVMLCCMERFICGVEGRMPIDFLPVRQADYDEAVRRVRLRSSRPTGSLPVSSP